MTRRRDLLKLAALGVVATAAPATAGSGRSAKPACGEYAGPPPFPPAQDALAKATDGVLIRVQIDGRASVDVDLGKRVLNLVLVDTGDLAKAKALRDLVWTWVKDQEEAAEQERLRNPKSTTKRSGPWQ